MLFTWQKARLSQCLQGFFGYQSEIKLYLTSQITCNRLTSKGKVGGGYAVVKAERGCIVCREFKSNKLTKRL